MAILTTSDTGVKLRMVESDISGLRQKCKEARAQMVFNVTQLEGLATKYKDLVDTFAQVGYTKDADASAKKAQWDALVDEYGVLLTNAQATLAAFNAAAKEF
jgi:hypothetical protein